MSTTAVIGPSKVIGTKSEEVKYLDRSAVRVIIKNDKGEIIIIHVTKGNYYKLPGGGVEADEGHILAAQREAMEETGCKVQLDGKCIATLVKDTGAPALTDEGKAEGLRHEWVSVELGNIERDPTYFRTGSLHQGT